MTPPDSGDMHECRCGYHIVGCDAEGSHAWSKCKPDSDEREVHLCEACGATYMIYPGPVRRFVILEPDLAQRILAALQWSAAEMARPDLVALAVELREGLPK